MFRDETTPNSETKLSLVKIPSRDDAKLVWSENVPLAVEVRAQPPKTSGSLDWLLSESFDDGEQALGWLEGLVSETEPMEAPVGRLCVVARTWIERGEKWDWNRAAKVANVTSEQVLRELSRGMQEVSRMVGLTKIAQRAGQLTDTALASAMMLGKDGFADRKMLLEALKIVESESGVNVNVNQQVGVKVEGMKGGGLAPLKQFSDTAREIDEQVREAGAIDVEVVEVNETSV